VGTATFGGSARRTFADHWDGAHWSLTLVGPLVHATRYVLLDGVSCGTVSSCWAVGNRDDGSNIAEHWNGTVWSQSTPPNVAGKLRGVSCFGPSFCFAVGATSNGALTERWSGSTWSVVPSPKPRPQANGVQLGGVACTAANRCVAAGSYAERYAPALLELWNGSTWVIEPPAVHAAKPFVAVSCRSSTDCLATGIGRDSAERWNGTKWTAP
jgi:hypothetical protein